MTEGKWQFIVPVAAYCRVSTDNEDQIHSFESQMRFFREYIQRHPDWTLYRIYADEGITGTSTRNRKQFNRMIHDARLGKIGLIITKEVSRFSRNVLDTIGYTRELKSRGIGVIFLNDGIRTLDPDSELRLSIMASIAQEESRRTSERVKWGQTQQMKHGVVFGHSMLGYDVENGKMTVNEDGAETVRLIFHKYGVERKGTGVIARELTEADIRTPTGLSQWNGSQVLKILKNEKYAGDLVQKKTITPDYLTHAKKYNHGEEELIVIKNHHEAIIERDLWDTVQLLICQANRHTETEFGHSNRYAFSGKIKCGECGKSFVARKRKRKNGDIYRRWCCITALRQGAPRTGPDGNVIGCGIGKQISDDLAMDILKQTLSAIDADRDKIINNVTALAMEAMQAVSTQDIGSAKKLEQRIQIITQKRTAALDAFLSKDITGEEMREMVDRYDRETEVLQKRLQAVLNEEDASGKKDDVRNRVTAIVNGEAVSEVLCKNILAQMIVRRDSHVEVTLNHLPMTWIFYLEKR